MRRRAWALPVVAMLVGASCTTTAKGPQRADDDAGERIVDPFDIAAEAIAALPGVPGGQIADALDDAVATRDVCALLFAMDMDLPDVDDPAGAVEAYAALARAATSGESFVPDDLDPWWPTIVEASERGADAVERVDGDLTHPSVAPLFTATEVQDAVRGVGRYRDTECEPPEDESTPASTTTTVSDATTTTVAPAP